MRRIVIIEDEALAAEHLIRQIHRIDPDIDICVTIPSVKSGIEWFITHKEYDLIFTDIQLADGLCFEIFKKVEVFSPIIFTTAYDQYALQAFKLNSIDYLLKPINKMALEKALQKLEVLQQRNPKESLFTKTQLHELLLSLRPEFKKRFSVKIGDRYRLIPLEDILYFMSQHKITYLFNKEGKKYPIQYSLQELEQKIDPNHFFRINRQIILSDQAILDVLSISNSRLKVRIPFSEKDQIVSRDRCADFKDWLDR